MNVERIADAKAEAISLDEARKQCRILGTDSDVVLRRYIEAARNYVESITRNPLVEGVYRFYFDCYEPFFKVHYPIVSITSIDYKIAEDTGEYEDSLSTEDYYYVQHEGRINIKNNAMSDLYAQHNAIRMTVVAGQPNIGSIPGDIILAMLLMIGHWYENREAVSVVQLNQIPMGAAALLGPYRAYSL